MSKPGVTLLLMLIGFLNGFGSVIRVPSDLHTIQAALDSISSGDTILVAPGRYREALFAPQLEFLLKGDVDPDSGIASLPTISPQGLIGWDTLNCLELPEMSLATIEDIHFSSGGPTQDQGGMCISSRAPVTLRHCALDSARRGLYRQWSTDSQEIGVSLFDCVLRNFSLHGINSLEDSVTAERCSFSNSTGSHHCLVADGSKFRNCTFDGSASFSAVVMNGDLMELSNCTFGPHSNGGASFLHFVQGLGSVFIHHNTFVGNTASVAMIRARGSVENSFVIEHNTFADNLAGPEGACIEITSGDSFRPDRGGTIRDNDFTNCFAGIAGANLIRADADITIESNRFIETAGEVNFLPAVSILNGVNTTIHQNEFIGTGYALFTNADSLHAEENWWGDVSGPYHETLNPAGLGDTISGVPVAFEPWLQDTTSASEYVSLPTSFRGHPYPNPFNSIVTIEYVIRGDQRVVLDIYDLLGRRVARLLDEIQPNGIHSVSWNAESVSSGIYFARLSSLASPQHSRTTKLLLLK